MRAVGTLYLLGSVCFLACAEAPAPVAALDSVTVAEDTTPRVGDTAAPEIKEPAWEAVALDPSASKPPKQLSATHLIRWNGSVISYHPDALRYVLNTPLFSDYAIKDRGLWVPAGKKATYQDNESFEFPVGTVVLKSFLFPADFREPEKNLRLIETRLLVMTEKGWKTWPYIWNEAGSDATLHVSGKVLDIPFIDSAGQSLTSHYMIPQKNQCVDCHEKKFADGGRMNVTIGLKARHLNRLADPSDPQSNQLLLMAEKDMLEGLPPLSEVPKAFDPRGVDLSALDAATRDKAARDYLDINCAHCHHPLAPEGQSSQLFLNHDNPDLFNLGICKLPGSAGKGGFGRKYNIVPGKPDESIMIYRVETEALGAMMPDIGRSLQDAAGVQLLRDWVSELDYPGCE